MLKFTLVLFMIFSTELQEYIYLFNISFLNWILINYSIPFLIAVDSRVMVWRSRTTLKKL